MPESHDSWRSKRNRWRTLGANDRRETLLAAVLVPLCGVSLQLCGLARTRDWFAARYVGDPGGHASAIPIATAAIERVRCHSPFAGTCLSRSLALEYLLARRGIRSELRIGVRRAADALAGHAWIEIDGRPLNDSPSVQREFAPLHK